jgi:hypothetical protein
MIQETSSRILLRYLRFDRTRQIFFDNWHLFVSKLRSWRDDGGQGIILQRFLDESTSYAETVTNGADLGELSEDKNEDDSSEDGQRALATPKERLNLSNIPMRGLSAFMFFANENREKIRMENPGISFGMCLDFCDPDSTNSPSGQIGKVLGDRWKALSESQREPYNKKAAADKKRYEDEKTKYNVT